MIRIRSSQMCHQINLRVWSFGFRDSDAESRVPTFGFRVPGSRIRVPGSGFQVSGLGFRVSGFGFRIPCFGIRDPGFGFRVPDLKWVGAHLLPDSQAERRELHPAGRCGF